VKRIADALERQDRETRERGAKFERQKDRGFAFAVFKFRGISRSFGG
jgi:hypothetical protein